MTDRKEIIRVLGFIQEYFDNHADAQETDKRKELFNDWSDTMLEAIALLKAQEPIKPRIGILHNEDGSKIYFLHCPLDGTTLDEGDKYCRKCGRAVSWE